MTVFYHFAKFHVIWCSLTKPFSIMHVNSMESIFSVKSGFFSPCTAFNTTWILHTMTLSITHILNYSFIQSFSGSICFCEDLVVLKRTKDVFVEVSQALSPLIHLASWISFGIIVTCLACMAQRLVSSKRPTK